MLDFEVVRVLVSTWLLICLIEAIRFFVEAASGDVL